MDLIALRIPAERRLAWRSARLALVLVPAGALLTHLAPETHPAWATVKMVTATLAIGMVPGMLLVAAALPRPRLTVLEWAGIGVAVSLGSVQILNILAMLLHVTAVLVATCTTVLTTVVAAMLWRRRPEPEAGLVLERGEILIGGLLAVLSVYLYLRGAPFWVGEDQIHVGVVRRLAVIPYPALNNIYFAHGVVYTYPFPGTHYVFALVSQLGGLDPLFVYHKMRFFWGPAALVFLYLASRLLFADRAVAVATAVTAIFFVFAGSFADVFGLYWAQLVPFSHASDVAMNVLLPGLLVLCLYFLRAERPRETRFFLGTTLLLVVMLVLVHIREIVQVIVYLAAFAVALVLGRRRGAELTRTLTLLVITVALTAAMASWQPHLVPRLPTLFEPMTPRLLEAARTLGPWGLVTGPFTDPNFVVGFETLFAGWNPLSVLLVPLIVFAHRRAPLMLFVGTSVFVYILLIRLPVLTIPFIYLTYPEIMYVPVRNVMFFLYLVPGALFHLVAARVASMASRRRALAATLIVLLALGGLSAGFGKVARTHPDVLFLPVIAMFAFVLAVVLRGRFERWSLLPSGGPPRVAAGIFLLLVLSMTVWTWVPLSAVRRVSLRRTPFTLRTLVGKLSCVSRPNVAYPRAPEMFSPTVLLPLPTRSCPPNLTLMTWANETIAPDAVLAINTFNQYPPPVFMTPHIVAWPLASENTNVGFVTPRYSDFFYRTIARYGTQPMFNTIEALDERLEFVRALGVTHVLVDPMYHDEMAEVLGRWPGTFPRLYDDGGWAVYGVSLLGRR
jgi:hypothetical protein